MQQPAQAPITVSDAPGPVPHIPATTSTAIPSLPLATPTAILVADADMLKRARRYRYRRGDCCTMCIDRRTRCSRARPACVACTKHGLACAYTVPRKRGEPKGPNPASRVHTGPSSRMLPALAASPQLPALASPESLAARSFASQPRPRTGTAPSGGPVNLGRRVFARVRPGPVNGSAASPGVKRGARAVPVRYEVEEWDCDVIPTLQYPPLAKPSPSECALDAMSNDGMVCAEPRIRGWAPVEDVVF
ncbi:hypothetical protein PLICRDRAFT_41206 [Plicaturopsis crispa FD-325 SS-3]|nr:hypothetical protein PLICRDRAFT_41206 [Plicaturopsis crispa FD-325 SS-3]